MEDSSLSRQRLPWTKESLMRLSRPQHQLSQRCVQFADLTAMQLQMPSACLPSFCIILVTFSKQLYISRRRLL